MLRIGTTSKIGYALAFLCVACMPLISNAAAEYVPLVGIPGVENTESGNLPQYLNQIYILLISIGALIAVVKIIIAGFKWSLSDIVTDKSAAKQDIKGALLGLAILLIPAIVLNTIYGNLTNMDFLTNAPTVDLTVTATPGNPGLADTNPNSNVAPAGMTFETCQYDATAITPITDEFSAANATYVHDDTACRRSCAEKNGKFLQLGKDSGRCTYAADPAQNNTPDLTDGVIGA